MNLKQHIPSQVHTLADILGKNNVRVAGGAVRDLLLGETPKDFDLATTLLPVDVMDILRAAGVTVVETGLQHGTVTAVLDGEPFEITTLRIDTETDGRHTKVVFTDDWQKDAERRDLTINAMFLDMDGNVHDFFNGQSDLDDNHVRFVGDADERIKEDYLRILRYFRFCGRLHVDGDPFTMEAIKRNVEGLRGISGERIWMEMQKILVVPPPTFLFLMEDMKQTGVLFAVGLPLMITGDGEELSRIANSMGAKPVTILAGLLDGNIKHAQDVVTNWKLSKVESTMLLALTQMIKEHGEDFVNLDLNWCQRQIVKEHVVREHVEEFARFFGDFDLVAALKMWEAPVFPVRGQDLLDLGMKPGPKVGETMRTLRILWERSGCKASREKLLENASVGL